MVRYIQEPRVFPKVLLSAPSFLICICTTVWMNGYGLNIRTCPFERFADDAIIHCRSERQAMFIKKQLEERLRACSLEMHAEKTKIVYCKDSNRHGDYPNKQFDFPSYTFMPRQAQNGRKDGSFTNWLPAVSAKAIKSMREKMKEWNTLRMAWCEIEDLAREINPVVRGWINYYGKFYQTKLKSFMREINLKIAKWARSKYKKVRTSELKAIKWLKGLSQRSPNFFQAEVPLLGKSLVMTV